MSNLLSSSATVIEVPEILYKYRNCNDHHFSMLEKNKIYLSCPSEFNDPFDCSVSESSFDEYNEDTAHEFFVKFGGVNPDDLRSEITKELFEDLMRDPQMKAIKESLEKDRKTLYESLGIFCLSTNPSSILMWSHYADNHRGFCIGFKSNSIPHKTTIKQVQYPKIRPNDYLRHLMDTEGLPALDKIDRLYRDLILTKSEAWEYEQEWRMIDYNHGMVSKGERSYEDDSIAQIIFGLNMSDKHKLAIVLLMRGKKVEFFQAVKSKSKFEIDLEPIQNPNLA